MDKMKYDIAGQVIGLANFGAARLEFKKKFRQPLPVAES
jgi:hypothetical protein